MGLKCFYTENITDKLSLSEVATNAEHRGPWWLWDADAKINLAMGSHSRESALIEGLEYYKRQAIEYKALYVDLQTKVNSFIHTLAPPKKESDDE